MTLLAIDPGRAVKASIGYCLFTDKGEEIARGELTWEELCRSYYLYLDRIDEPELCFLSPGRLTPWTVTEVVIENFINNEKSRGGQTNGASEVIGAVEILAVQAGVPFTRQRPDRLPVAMKHAQYELPINPRTKKPVSHLPHQDSAYLHGYHYLVGKGVLQPKGLAATL